MIIFPPGATCIHTMYGLDGVEVQISRSVTSRIEAFVTTSEVDLFRPGLKVAWVTRLAPLKVAGTVGTEGVGLVSTLFLGPVRIDWGRVWGQAPSRWAVGQLSADSQMSLLIGVRATGIRIDPFAGVRLFPLGHALFEIGLSVSRDEVRCSVGGVLW